MKIAIIDDKKEDIENLTRLLREFFLKHNIEFSINKFSSAENFLKVFEKDMFDLCFMDIFMDGMNGMQASRILYQKDSACMIIFLTTSNEFLAEGYDVRAWRYLIKPITTNTIYKILPDCVEKISTRQCRLKVTVNRIETQIPFSKILYVLSSNRKTEIYLHNEKIELSSHIPFSKTIEPLLKDYRFIQCGKGIVVNMSHIINLTGHGFLMNDKHTIPISRRELPEVKKKYLAFSFDNL